MFFAKRAVLSGNIFAFLFIVGQKDFTTWKFKRDVLHKKEFKRLVHLQQLHQSNQESDEGRGYADPHWVSSIKKQQDSYFFSKPGKLNSRFTLDDNYLPEIPVRHLIKFFHGVCLGLDRSSTMRAVFFYPLRIECIRSTGWIDSSLKDYRSMHE